MAAMRPDPRNHAPTAQTGGQDVNLPVAEQDWLERAKNAFYSSTTYVDSNLRKGWEDSIRAFNNQHPSDSKYNAPAFDKRSKVYRPKVRTVIRKNEAAAAAAFFSNMEVVSVDPNDPNDKAECASSDIMKQLLQYRLTKTIPWYQVVLGGLQDAQVTGVACAHIYWDYQAKNAEEEAEDLLRSFFDEAKGESAHPAQAPLDGEGEENLEYPEQSPLGMPKGAMVATDEGGLAEPGAVTKVTIVASTEPPKPRVDKPVIELFPAENLRIDPGANWMDPIGTSPYVIHLMPMYVMDVKDRMESGEWRRLSNAVISAATEIRPDTTRIARQKDRDDPYSADSRSVDDYEVVWVQRHIHRRDGTDWEFYTMGDLALLTNPRRLKETVFHGKRPYVMGYCNMETHKVFPSSLPTLARGLSDETNEIANQRIDNIKFVLNKKYFVKRGKEADIAGLVRNVPGGVVMLDDPQNDVREMTWQDVTASSFQEAQGIGMEMDELLGNFNPANIMAQGGANSPARNMAMVSNSQGTLVEYALRTFVETFVQPVLRQLVQLEQEYETDVVVMKIAAKRADLFQKYGIDEVTDDLLQRELTLSVNVGMGATDPMMRLNKFLTAMNAYSNMLQKPTPGIDMQEVGKEIFGHLGYSDGTRFFSGEDPQVLALQAQLQQAQGIIGQLQQKVQEKNMAHQIALQKTQISNQTSLQKANMSNQTALRRTDMSNQAALQRTAMQEQAQNQRALATHWRALHERDVETNNQMAQRIAQQAMPPVRRTQ